LIGRRGEVKGIGIDFRGFLWGNTFFLDHSCFNSCFDLFVLGSTLRLYFCSRQERRAPSPAVVSRETYADVGACLEGKSLILVFCICKLTFWSLFEHVPRRLPSVASNRGWYRCAFPWVIYIILYKSQIPMFSYCITLRFCSVYARQSLCLADYLAYCNTYLVSVMISCYVIVSLRGPDV